MSKKYEEYISGIRIGYDNKLHLCPYKDCFNLKNNKLEEIENNMGDIYYMNEEEDLERYDQEEEEILTCECLNEIIFVYNPYEIIKKNF